MMEMIADKVGYTLKKCFKEEKSNMKFGRKYGRLVILYRLRVRTQSAVNVSLISNVHTYIKIRKL